MDELRENFSGVSASRLQTKFEELSNTFNDLLSYLQQKAEMMQSMTANVTAADEE